MQSVELVGRLLVSLLAVLVVIWLLGRKLRKGGRLKDSKLIDVLGRQQLTRNAAVAVVRVGDTALVVGVTDAAINVLGETDLAAAQAAVSTLRTTDAAASGHRRGARRRAMNPAPIPSVLPPQASAQPVAVAVAAPPAIAQPSLLQPPVDAQPLVAAAPAPTASPLAGSALSPQTWRQTIESLREMTSR